MAHEITSDVWAIAYGYNARPIATFVAKVKHLRWSNPRITRAVEHEAQSLHEMATLRQPDLCADVRAWADDRAGVDERRTRQRRRGIDDGLRVGMDAGRQLARSREGIGARAEALQWNSPFQHVEVGAEQ